MTTTRELPPGSPAEVGMSAERLQSIDDLVQEYIDAGHIQGAVVGVTRRNQVVYLEAHGVLDDTTERPMTTDAMFHMASSTKPVLGVAAMMMIEEGLISPDDPVEKYIPEFKGIQVAVAKESADKNITKSKSKSKEAYKKQEVPDHRLVDVSRPLTIHDLLTHTAGLHTGGIGSRVSTLDRPGRQIPSLPGSPRWRLDRSISSPEPAGPTAVPSDSTWWHGSSKSCRARRSTSSFRHVSSIRWT